MFISQFFLQFIPETNDIYVSTTKKSATLIGKATYKLLKVGIHDFFILTLIHLLQN